MAKITTKDKKKKTQLVQAECRRKDNGRLLHVEKCGR